MIRTARAALRTMSGTTSQARVPLIGTHSGHFHADESLAVYLLRLLPEYQNSSLVRSRDPEILKACDIVVDVGGEYDAKRSRFDHHQRDFKTVFPGRTTKLSSAGLVFMHYGKAIIAQRTGLPMDSDEANSLFVKLYEDFVEAFDANDNGISAYDTAKLSDLGVSKRFNDRGFSIAAVVNRFNYDKARTNAARTGDQNKLGDEQAEEDARFLQASEFTGGQFLCELTDAWQSWLPARKEVRTAFDQRGEHDPSNRILVLPHKKDGLPWQSHLYSIENESGLEGQVLYVLFPETGDTNSKWRVRAVSKNAEGFDLRKPLPENWRGLRDDELSQVASINGCVFVHASGFIGGNQTYQGALAMARKALT